MSPTGERAEFALVAGWWEQIISERQKKRRGKAKLWPRCFRESRDPSQFLAPPRSRLSWGLSFAGQEKKTMFSALRGSDGGRVFVTP